MKALWLIPALALATSAFAAGVFEAHDKEPQRFNHHACDSDDHDPAKCKSVTQASVPEGATLPLLVLGLGALAVATRRRKP